MNRTYTLNDLDRLRKVATALYDGPISMPRGRDVEQRTFLLEIDRAIEARVHTMVLAQIDPEVAESELDSISERVLTQTHLFYNGLNQKALPEHHYAYGKLKEWLVSRNRYDDVMVAAKATASAQRGSQESSE